MLSVFCTGDVNRRRSSRSSFDDVKDTAACGLRPVRYTPLRLKLEELISPDTLLNVIVSL